MLPRKLDNVVAVKTAQFENFSLSILSNSFRIIMENTRKESDLKDPQIIYWSELHTCHLTRKIDPLMLDEGGRTELINCILRNEGPRSPGGAQKRRVIFDQNFILYRVLTLLAPLQFYEAKFLLNEIIPRMVEGKSISEVLNELCLPPNAVDTPEEEDVSTDILDSTFAPFLDEIEDDIPLVVNTEQSVVAATLEQPGKSSSTAKKGKKKNV